MIPFITPLPTAPDFPIARGTNPCYFPKILLVTATFEKAVERNTMQVIQTEIPGVLIIEPKRFGDQRGFFVEMFHADRYSALGLPYPFVQDNWSRSSRGVLRGLHLQHPNAQSKLVSVITGEILDVAVDVRVGSPTYGQHVAVSLSGENGRQLLVPRGFAHGFVVLSDTVDLLYKCDNFYSPADEITIRWNDPAIGIGWPIPEPLLSARDAAAPILADVKGLPQYAE
jgi:dTDP-4-dehydrorhamnose 3,5-epimerase